ncbi:MAG: beta-galactosidase [Verrucomicrobiota bacterium]|jgi:hypothetical protein
MNRREFARLVGTGAVGAAALGKWGESCLMATAAAPEPLARRGVFLVRGKPVFLVSGSVDYFRCPPELWRDRLLKAKRGGLNCIASCIVWNFHETEQGRFNFSGEHDLGRFIDLCGELGLYFFARVGPFICDEWDGGGHPAWLIAKDDIQFRAMHEPTLKYVRRWFEHLLPILVRRQVTRGGPVILVQQENEYYYANRPDGRDYQATLVRWMRELGIEVTITDCNGFETRVPGSLQTLNGFNLGAAERYRGEHPDLPVLCSEIYTGYLDCWGLPPATVDASLLHRQLMEMLASRVMWNYFMYHGGTNFGFRASSSWKTDDAFVTTCYYPTAQLAEGGGFNNLFFATKTVDQLGTNFQDFFSQAAAAQTPVKAEGAIRVSALRAPQGTMVFVFPGEKSGPAPSALILPSGERLEFAESSAQPIMTPFEYRAFPDCRIDWANATLLGVAGSSKKPTLVFIGDAWQKGRASINGRRIEFSFASGDPVPKEATPAQIIGLSHELASRAWFADGRLVIGPAYVGERAGGRHECWLTRGKTPVLVVESDGRHRRESVTAAPTPDGQVPLKDWRSYPLPEIHGGGNGWQAMDGPKSLEQLGSWQGYAWYRAVYRCEQAHSTTLQFTRAADRFHVFLNGQKCGVWGRGNHATRDPLSIELAAGENDFVLLCDNMGHSSEGRAQERKGILGPVVLGAQSRSLGAPERFTPAKPPSTNYEFETYRALNGSGARFTGFAWTVARAAGERLLLTLRAVPQYAWLGVNGEIVGEHGGDFSLVDGFSFKEFLLPVDLSAGPVRIEVILFGGELADIGKHVCLFAYPEQPGLTQWRFKPWETPRAAGPAAVGSPVWWECGLARPKLAGPLFLHPVGLSKGQAYLNGRAAGRYWDIGPQKALYLPEPWWKEQNRLAIFDEGGRHPGGSFLARDARVPTMTVKL